MVGGPEKLARRLELVEALSKTSWGDKSKRHFLTREQEYVQALQAALGIWEKMKKENLSIQDGLMMRSLVDFPGGLELHIGMFIPTILSQGDPEQQAEWLPKCNSLEIIGTYAQTELGHGTFVRGLETTATYDPATQEFIMHSPTLTSTKWWPGGMGKTSTHAVVMARLIIKGKDYGPHAFIVQLRSLRDHKPMPGIKVGDIGNKVGFGGVDNGFMSMEYVRIPRNHMLMRFSKVAPDGTYTPPPAANSKASYATMVYVRADIVKNSGGALSKAVTIAVRYAAVRRQTAPAPGQREVQVLDYQNCMHTLLPLLAASYSLHFMGESLFGMYRQFEKDRDAGDFSLLPELHALSSGLKALCTWVAADGIEECRRTCGGHGYSRLSGLPTLFQNYVQNVTWEGDNNVLCLQTGRYLIKALGQAAAGKRPKGSASYLGDVQQELAARSPASCQDCWLKPEVQLGALQHRAARMAVAVTEQLARANGGQLRFEGHVWNANTVEVIRLAKAHCSWYLLQNFISSIDALEGRRALDSSTIAVLRRVAALHGLSLIEQDLGDFLEDGYLSGKQAQDLRHAHRALLVALRPEAVALVDSFGWEDYTLNSALGREDGDVYRALLDMAQGAPLNETEEGPAWEGVLKPVMLAAQRSRL